MAKWTMQGAENAVKASFVKRAIADDNEALSLRYSDIRSTINESHTISDRTLSKALKRLQERNELNKKENGQYELTIEWGRPEQLEVIFVADALSIEAGMAVGMIGDQKKGWTYYGVPLGKPRQLRPQLRRAAIEFQDRIDEILQNEANRVIETTLKKAQKRGLSTSRTADIRRILMGIFDYWESLRIDHLDSFAWVIAMEKMAPGVFPEIIQKLLAPPIGVRNDLLAGIPVHESMAKRSKEWIPYLARLYGDDRRSIEEEWPSLQAEAKAGVIAMNDLRKALLAKDWRTFNSHWSSILAARYWLCAVIR
jgi:hypothetical protein